ncbi:MAG: carbonate dehydratase [Bacteroidetes bacterium]|jgi:carbonic anhydrase|nr:carbonate dehydratase [Bacteroidota bacterium]
MPDRLLKRNREWAAGHTPGFFDKLTERQAPRFLWVSCSDSRVPANEIVGCEPGDLFVHRNIANLIDHGDLNALSVLQYAVDVLDVPHIVVCGHYRCGGVRAAMEHTDHGLIDNWLRPIKDLYHRHADELEALDNEQARWDRLCELNVIKQIRDVACSTIVQKAWQRGHDITIHGWIYRLDEGLIRDLDASIEGPHQVPAIYRSGAAQAVPQKE